MEALEPADKQPHTDRMPDLDAIEARVKAATPRPWVHEPSQPELQHAAQVFGPIGDGDAICDFWGSNPRADADAAFIAHAREDVPALIARVRDLEARNLRMMEDGREPMREDYNRMRERVTEQERRNLHLRAQINAVAERLRARGVGSAWSHEETIALLKTIAEVR